MKPRILVLHGPNLNLLGVREPSIYGGKSLSEIDDALKERARVAEAELETFQSNDEGAIVTRLQAARGHIDAIVINAAAYTHTSIAIRDALVFAEIPAVEVHLSNTSRREPFRHHSMLADVCVGVIAGFGALSYLLGFDAALAQVNLANLKGKP